MFDCEPEFAEILAGRGLFVFQRAFLSCPLTLFIAPVFSNNSRLFF